jgi:hypothetical protein
MLRNFERSIEAAAQSTDVPSLLGYIERALRRVLEERLNRIS